MIEIFYLSHNRREFTEASLAALRANTEFSFVSGVTFYDDCSTDGTATLIDSYADKFPGPVSVKHVRLGGPVACMNAYITSRSPEMFCKVDNDTMLPPGWLGDCMNVMDRHPWLDLLGIEPMRKIVAAPLAGRMIDEAGYIGGIGLMRGRAFEHSLPRPDGRFGFTAWQENTPVVRKGWLSPALPVFLLDRLPIEPWASLSRQYIASGWQRAWAPYSMDMRWQWDWWAQ